MSIVNLQAMPVIFYAFYKSFNNFNQKKYIFIVYILLLPQSMLNAKYSGQEFIGLEEEEEEDIWKYLHWPKSIVRLPLNSETLISFSCLQIYLIYHSFLDLQVGCFTMALYLDEMNGCDPAVAGGPRPTESALWRLRALFGEEKERNIRQIGW